ncbi:prephenate dehydratase [Desulfonema magnum]|uniref:Prephenate dehydratase n=1 Tax=Desulfonema magnum TaxID=45655 RepID=A0A975BKJ1_9BACT|nr:prephenate dehydratase [Desulfonema magnum]QTA87096.1 Prephenate dehydratase family protein [Desulfonema magnum]
MKIAFQGIKGAYSELALYEHFGRNAESVGFDSFDEMFEAVADASVDFAVVPVENTIAGTVVENYDLLLSHDIFIVAEIFMKIRHTLLAKKGVVLNDIKEAYSHPHALRQCKEFLRTHNIEPMPVYDTAGAAERVSQWDRKDCAAIASELCAEIYGMDILSKDIQTNKSNTTRFFVIIKKENLTDEIVHEKTTIAFKIQHYPGALVDCLKTFQENRLNLTKLESRPIPENPWEYVFYTDFDGGMDSEVVRHTLEELEQRSLFIKILGSYPKGTDCW